MHLCASTTGTAIFVLLPHPPRPCPTTAVVAVFLGIPLGSCRMLHAEPPVSPRRIQSPICDEPSTNRRASRRSDRYEGTAHPHRNNDQRFRMTHSNSQSTHSTLLGLVSLFPFSNFIVTNFYFLYCTNTPIHPTHLVVDFAVKLVVSRGFAKLRCRTNARKRPTYHAFARVDKPNRENTMPSR